jgi:hypothetical protein
LFLETSDTSVKMSSFMSHDQCFLEASWFHPLRIFGFCGEARPVVPCNHFPAKWLRLLRFGQPDRQTFSSSELGPPRHRAIILT